MIFYCINLDDQKERWRKCQKEFKAQDLTVERVSATSQGEVPFLPKTHYRCALSHFDVCRRFLASDSEYAVIFEDDVMLLADFKKRLDLLILKLKTIQWGIVFLGRTTNHHSNTTLRPQPILDEFDDELITNSYPLGTVSYLINRDFAKAILELSTRPFGYYDVELGNICRRLNLPILSLKRSIAYENVFVGISTTENNSLRNVHEAVNLSLYRPEYEIPITPQNDIEFDDSCLENDHPIFVDHLLDSSDPSIDRNDIIRRGYLSLYGGKWGDLIGDENILRPLLHDVIFVTNLTSEVGFLYFDGLQYAKFIVYVKDRTILLNLPIYPNMEIRICNKLPVKEDFSPPYTWIDLKYSYTPMYRSFFNIRKLA